MREELKILENGSHPHFIFPTHYQFIPPSLRFVIQNNYIETIKNYYRLNSLDIKIHRKSDLFPIELFNLTDKPLIR